MNRVIVALAALFGFVALAATRVDEPKSFVTQVYQRFIAAQSSGASYTPPSDIYSARLGALFRKDKQRARGEVGCLDFDFWVNAQDWEISDVSVTSSDEGPQRKTVIAKFLNIGKPQEIHFDFRRNGGRWQLDDVHSVLDPRWTLSEILQCAP